AVVSDSVPPPMKFSLAEWQNKIRKWSLRFAYYPGVTNSSVTVTASREVKYLVSTEGTRVRHGRGFARIIVSARSRTVDGMELEAGQTFEAEDVSRLPKDSVVLAAIDRAGIDLEGLKMAPVAEPYVGPAILSGSASAVFFHEIFGHRIEGHRQKDDTEGQTFTKSVGKPILPEFLSVSFDPTKQSAYGVNLYGAYAYDDEGVKARPVTVVEHGILKSFLLSRSPIAGFPNSNGHGRKQISADAVSRQSNLFVESAKAVPEARLREMLLEEIRKQGKPYGLYFKQVTGGFTQTQRRGLQAFTVIPLVVYRVYADGKPDQLVRGADIVGTPLASFAKILATSDRVDVFNGFCGAESGSVPVSAASPALLVSEIEVQKKATSQERSPLLPRPPLPAGEGR
ncbi:MAG: metallopeptidase TldD-related protein, partial [Acidobacteria bacterium]|nr:metallopeptidase TldD-related protein [Acidobacteriota bacterium]